MLPKLGMEVSPISLSRYMLILQRQIIKNPTPTLTLPLKGRGFYGVFSLYEGDFMGFSHFHGSFSNPSPFKGEVRRGMGYICRCSINLCRKNMDRSNTSPYLIGPTDNDILTA